MKINFKVLGALILLLCFGCTAQPRSVNSKESEKVVTPKKILSGKIICVDPGHAVTLLKKKEKLSPLSEITKDAYINGTSGKKLTEEKLNLIVALKLRRLLEDNGAKVIMTREVSEISISNIERAEMANNGNADIAVHIHADYSANPSTQGVSVLIPGGKLLREPRIIEPSKNLGKSVSDCIVANTGAENHGTVTRSDLTGFNWSKVPTVLIEVGFMSNSGEDALLNSDIYQNKIAEGICGGIINYFATAQS